MGNIKVDILRLTHNSPVADCCGLGNEPLGSLKVRNVLTS